MPDTDSITADKESFADFRRRWSGIVFDLTPENLRTFIRDTLALSDEPYRIPVTLDLLRFRFDTPDFVFELLDELRDMDASGTKEPEDYLEWGERARAALQLYIADTSLQSM
jgi:hypothetical protein